MMTRLAKRIFTGTPLEEPLKRAHHALTGQKSTLYDWQTIAIMRRVLRPDSNAIDVGAFEGGMLKHLIRLAPRGRHMAFEPQPDRCERLRAAFPRVDVHASAVGDRAGVVTFHCMDPHPALSGLERRARDLPGEHARAIQVPMETLDGTVPPDRPLHFVKVDVEGAEMGVFRGGVNVLRANRPVIVFECGLGGADHFGTTPRALHDLVTGEIGLRLSLLGGWLRGAPALSAAEFADQFERRLHFYFVAHP
ncbi:MAG TPA: FkbM family methyltransferase [Candidatus Eisenbacteria bacterium]|nr:FkbM family methyltransferase [Candidatus Eisenbacteria bacterium]